MPQTRACDYCGADIEPGTGTMFVTTSGTVTYFCSAKCEKNADLGREPRDLGWTEAGAGGDAAPPEAEPAPEPETAADLETPDLEAAEADAEEPAVEETDDTADAAASDANVEPEGTDANDDQASEAAADAEESSADADESDENGDSQDEEVEA